MVAREKKRRRRGPKSGTFLGTSGKVFSEGKKELVNNAFLKNGKEERIRAPRLDEIS